MTFSKVREDLKKERKKRNLTQKEVATYIDIHFSTYSNIERGKRNPSLRVAQKIADFFGIEIKTLIG